MKQIIKGFGQFINENDSAIHQIHRDAHNDMLSGNASLTDSPEFTDRIKKINSLSPEEKAHFFKLAKRTQGAREKDMDAVFPGRKERREIEKMRDELTKENPNWGKTYNGVVCKNCGSKNMLRDPLPASKYLTCQDCGDSMHAIRTDLTDAEWEKLLGINGPRYKKNS